MDLMMGGDYGMYNDAHNAAVGTYGALRGDSQLSINVAYKGMGWVPVEGRIVDRTLLYSDEAGSSLMSKVQILKDGYEDSALWRRDLLCSLELYTHQGFETHTFLNQMTNHVSSICFLVSPPSYKIQTIARLMHPSDPGLTTREKQILTWANFAHDFFHSSPPLVARFPAVAYFVVEQTSSRRRTASRSSRRARTSCSGSAT